MDLNEKLLHDLTSKLHQLRKIIDETDLGSKSPDFILAESRIKGLEGHIAAQEKHLKDALFAHNFKILQLQGKIKEAAEEADRRLKEELAKKDEELERRTEELERRGKELERRTEELRKKDKRIKKLENRAAKYVRNLQEQDKVNQIRQKRLNDCEKQINKIRIALQALPKKPLKVNMEMTLSRIGHLVNA